MAEPEQCEEFMRTLLGITSLVAFLCAAGTVVTPADADPSRAVDAARSFRQQHGPRILREYAELLEVPNVPGNPASQRRNAELIRDGLAARGVHAELLELDGVPPIVFGKLDAPGATRTLGIYLHYDGQPVDPEQWTHPPFEPTLYTAAIEAGGEPRPLPRDGESIDPEWRLYARSSGDDKVPVPALFGALDALRDAKIPPTSNLLFFFEGEEEQGSDHLGDYFAKYRARLDADLWLICDGPVHQSRQPQLVFGVRGYTGLEITVYGAKRYLHSGHYGNWAPNPALELARLLASMKDDNGRVLIDGFYDSVAPLTEKEKTALATVPTVDASLRKELGLAATEADDGLLVERLLLPSFNIRGMQSAAVGEKARNLIPIEAEASIDIRLVKGNDPEAMLDLVERHIEGRGYRIVRDAPDETTRASQRRIARVVRRPGYPAVRTSMDLPLANQLVRAAEAAAGESLILLPGMGGSLPLYLFTEQLGQPIVIVPIANHDDNQHAPDENLRLANLWYGIDLFAAILTMPPN
jgi:acetylornithine deacetylase/succinyl-diaminopimelate desuccinylase-like protein